MSDQLTPEQILRLSKCKDGDVIVVSSDTVSHDQIHKFADLVRKHTGKNLAVIGLPAGDSITVLEAEEARTILEHLARKGAKQ